MYNGNNIQALIQLQKAVVKIIYYLRAQTKLEKQQRSDYYARLFIKDKKKKKSQEEGRNNIDLDRIENQEGNDGVMNFNNDQDSENNQEGQ